MTSLTFPVELQLTPQLQALLDLLQKFQSNQAVKPSEAQPAHAVASSTPPDHGEYWPGQGGRYICTMPDLLGLPAHHLIAGTDEATLTFGPREDIAGTSSHTDGRANTAARLASGKPHPAAQWHKQQLFLLVCLNVRFTSDY